ncbi:MAG: DinB family protein [Gemmatimonadaceae bacterium]|nr:DinB family protein [Gemmatimonadaceae bacterium]
MSRMLRTMILAAALAPALPAQSNDWRQEFLAVMQTAADKYIQLAEAIPADKYTWRPAEGVRSVAETFLHVATANYGLASNLGAQLPAGVPVRTLEKSTTDKAVIVKHLRDAFAHFRGAVEAFPADQPTKMVRFFGPPEITARHFLYFNADHNGEHLGQLIAYARSVGVTPPWSAGN